VIRVTESDPARRYPFSMRTACIAAAALSLISVASAHAQRQFRIAPIYSTLNLQDLSGASHGFSS